MSRLVAVSLVLALAATACQKPPPGGAAAPPPASARTPAASTQTPPRPAPLAGQLPPVVARVNGKAVAAADLQRAIRAAEAQAGSAVPPDRRDEVFRSILDQLVILELLNQETLARKVTVTGQEVERRLAEVRGQFPNAAAFEKAMADSGVLPEQVRENARLDVAISKLLEAEAGAVVQAPDAEVEQFYKANPTQFVEGETRRARHILFRVDGAASGAVKQRARAQAETVLAMARRGDDFAALARQHSQDPGSAPSGGDLGFFGQGQTVKPFETAALALKPGQVSSIVVSPFGYHIIKLEEIRASRQASLEEAREQIRRFLAQQRRQREVERFIDSIRAKAKIEILI